MLRFSLFTRYAFNSVANHRRRWVLREMRYYQRTTHNLIPKSVFERVVREIARDIRPDIRFKKSAIADIQTVAEAELVKLFTNADKLTRHRKRKTLTRRDLTLVCDIIKSVCENSYHKGDQYR